MRDKQFPLLDQLKVKTTEKLSMSGRIESRRFLNGWDDGERLTKRASFPNVGNLSKLLADDILIFFDKLDVIAHFSWMKAHRELYLQRRRGDDKHLEHECRRCLLEWNCLSNFDKDWKVLHNVNFLSSDGGPYSRCLSIERRLMWTSHATAFYQETYVV